MFEKEIMISGLKKNSRTLASLVEELEGKSRMGDFDLTYCHETLRRIEMDLRKIRKMDEETNFVTRVW